MKDNVAKSEMIKVNTKGEAASSPLVTKRAPRAKSFDRQTRVPFQVDRNMDLISLCTSGEDAASPLAEV